MRKFLLILNGKAIADYFYRGNAENAFARRVRTLDKNSILELYNIETGHRIASSI